MDNKDLTQMSKKAYADPEFIQTIFEELDNNKAVTFITEDRDLRIQIKLKLKTKNEYSALSLFTLKDFPISDLSVKKSIPIEDLDELYEDAKNIVLTEKTSISYVQRRLQIGYNRSAKIIEQLENNGILSGPNAKGNREVVGN
jgi:DNA segregation ATPase FtsK/SpoIIIE-like protein